MRISNTMELWRATTGLRIWAISIADSIGPRLRVPFSTTREQYVISVKLYFFRRRCEFGTTPHVFQISSLPLTVCNMYIILGCVFASSHKIAQNVISQPFQVTYGRRVVFSPSRKTVRSFVYSRQHIYID